MSTLPELKPPKKPRSKQNCHFKSRQTQTEAGRSVSVNCPESANPQATRNNDNSEDEWPHDPFTATNHEDEVVNANSNVNVLSTIQGTYSPSPNNVYCRVNILAWGNRYELQLRDDNSLYFQTADGQGTCIPFCCPVGVLLAVCYAITLKQKSEMSSLIILPGCAISWRRVLMLWLNGLQAFFFFSVLL